MDVDDARYALSALDLPATQSVDETDSMSDAGRLERLFESSADRLYRLARRLSRSDADAQDLLQEAFLRAANATKLPVADSDAEHWMVRVVVNLSRDASRRRLVRERSDHELHPMPTHSLEAQIVARQTVEAALATLPARRRAVIVMHELEGLDVAQIANVLGTTRVTVRWHLARGRHELRRWIEGCPEKGLTDEEK